MKQKYIVQKLELTTADIRPLAQFVARHHAIWFATPGSLVIDRERLDGERDDIDVIRVVRRYWLEAILAIPWLPYAMAPRGSSVVELALAEIPAEHVDVVGNAPKVVSIGAEYLAAIQYKWNSNILALGLVAGAQTDSLTQHMDSIRERLAKSVTVVDSERE